MIRKNLNAEMSPPSISLKNKELLFRNGIFVDLFVFQ